MTPEKEHLIAQLGMVEAPCEHGGDLALRMPLASHLTNSRGGLQGGLVATLADVVAGIAVIDPLPVGEGAATSDLALHFLSAVTVGPAHAEATVVRRGKRAAVVQIEVYDVGRDTLAAICTATFAMLALREGQLGHAEGVADGALNQEARREIGMFATPDPT